MDKSICSSCSQLLCSDSKYLTICKACSSSLVEHIFSPARYSALNSVLALRSETEMYKDLALKRVLQYNSMNSKENLSQKRGDEGFIEDFYNLSLYGQSCGLECLFVLDSGLRLFQFSLDDMNPLYYENIELSHCQDIRYASAPEGYILLCATRHADSKAGFYLYQKTHNYSLLCYGISPFKGNPSLSLAGNTIYTFLEADYSYKFNYEKRHWERLLVEFYGKKDLFSVQVGSKIILTASNSSSLFMYNMLGDYLSEFEEIFLSGEPKGKVKIVLYDGFKVYCICGGFIKTTDLRFLRYEKESRVNTEINLVISPPVMYKDKFFILSSENIYRFSPENSRIEKISISGSTSSLSFIQSFN